MSPVALTAAALSLLLPLASTAQIAPAESGGPRAPGAAHYFLRDYEDALAESAATGKPVFLDAFTTWCKPCRQMDALVFSEPDVEALLQRDFVPLRVDMESPAGLALAERFPVTAYPTLIVLDADGELHRATGYHTPEDLAAFAKTSLDPTRNFRGLRARHALGDRDPALLLALERAAEEANSPLRERYAYDYLVTTGDWDGEAAGERLLRAPQTTDTPLFDSLVARRRQLHRQFSVPIVEERIDRLVDATLFPGEGLAAKPRDAKRVLRRAYGPRPGAPEPRLTRADSAYYRFRMRRAREAGKAKAFGRWAIRSQARFPTGDPDELTELIYIFGERLPGWKPAVVADWQAREDELRAARGW